MGNNKIDHLLSECFVSVFAYTMLLKQTCVQRQPAFEEVSEKLRSLFLDSAEQMRTLGVDPRDYDDARFAVCAWVDETILNMPWMHKAKWQRFQLQTEFYNTKNAGDEFFERLTQLSPDQHAVREVYYVCLCLGFMGRYCHDGDELLLEQLKQSTLNMLTGNIEGLRAYTKKIMFDDAYQGKMDQGGELQANKTRSAWLISSIWLIFAPPVLLLFLFFVYSLVLNGVVGNVIARVIEG